MTIEELIQTYNRTFRSLIPLDYRHPNGLSWEKIGGQFSLLYNGVLAETLSESEMEEVMLRLVDFHDDLTTRFETTRVKRLRMAVEKVKEIIKEGRA